jgi:hypothetical protein
MMREKNNLGFFVARVLRLIVWQLQNLIIIRLISLLLVLKIDDWF